MTITLNLKPEVEAGLMVQAQASGMTVEAYLLAMVEGVVLQEITTTLSPERRAKGFEAWSANHRATPPLSDFAVNREAMYDGQPH
jgi:hypothetical protein